MSAATARRAHAHAPARPATAAPARPDLRVIPPQPFRAPRGPFVLAIGAVLTLGLLGVLLLNTVVAQDAFTVTALTQKSAALADQEQMLTQQVAVVESPERLETRARALGMVPSLNPGFLRLADGKVLGEPVAGRTPVRRAAAPAVVVPAAGSSPNATATPEAGATSAPTTGKQATPNAVRTKASALRTKAAKAAHHDVAHHDAAKKPGR